MLQEKCFLWAIVLLPFVLMPRPLILALPGSMWGHASVYPVLLGLSLWFWNMRQTKSWTVPRHYIWYAGLLLGWTLVTVTVGVVHFPFYQQLDSSQFHKVAYLLAVGKYLGYSILPTDRLVMVLLLLVKIFFAVTVDFIMTIGVSFWVYSLYRHQLIEGLLQLRRGLFYSFLLAGGYSIIEVFFLGGSNSAQTLLVTVNPLLFPQNLHGWWPPLLGYGQVRSLCLEPSFFGLYAAFVSPFFISYLCSDKGNKRYFILVLWLFFLVAMTKARTAIGLFLAEVLCLCLIVFVQKRVLLYKKLAVILAVIVVAVLLASHFPLAASQLSEVSESSNLETLVSLANPQGRSNASRYMVLEADAMMARDHPVLGVGSHFSSAYFPDYVVNKQQNEETSSWLAAQKANGPLSGYYNFNHYIFLAAEIGFPGLILFVLPLILIIIKSYQVLRRSTQNFALLLACFIALLGSMGGLMSNSDVITYGYYLLWGFGLILLEQA
jgi:hypothetical protein